MWPLLVQAAGQETAGKRQMLAKRHETMTWLMILRLEFVPKQEFQKIISYPLKGATPSS